jgi:hypothetical protein
MLVSCKLCRFHGGVTDLLRSSVTRRCITSRVWRPDTYRPLMTKALCSFETSGRHVTEERSPHVISNWPFERNAGQVCECGIKCQRNLLAASDLRVCIFFILISTRVRRIAKSDYSLRQVCPSVRPHGKTRLLLDGFSWNLISEDFSDICQENSGFIKIWQE